MMYQQHSPYHGRRVLVAGGTGMIGIPLVRTLLTRGAQVTVVSLEKEDYAKALFGPTIRFFRGDLTQYTTCEKAVEGQEYVFNLVGIKGSVGIGVKRAASYFVPMLRYQSNLLEAAYRMRVSRYLFVSSICAYPPSALHEEDNLWNGLPKQNDRYAGIAKRVGEIEAETYLHEYQWDAVRIVRPSNVYGPFDDFNSATGQVIPALIRRVLDGERPIRIWGDGSVIRDFIFSQDVVDGLLLAVEHAPPCFPVNLGSGLSTTIKELAEIIVAESGVNTTIEWDPSQPSGDPIRLLSMERAKKTLGFCPSTSLTDGIRQTLQWYTTNRELAHERKNLLSA
ncbi:MAG: NAD-dependent epimerase/dehydratase family protein [Nitrospirota bacterium]|nr:NAD-dependent epimerase/dehydratase family protein [Nitrospirota bacterium]MDH5586710.1 NAD-dependent epimerase/dehydratase family protein [Nitrospirota bacterium]